MIDSGLVGIVIVATVGTLFVLVMMFSQKRLPQEKQLKPLYQERCAGYKKLRLGFRMGATFPTWRISLYDDFIVLGLGKPIVVKYENIEHVKCIQAIFSRKIEIKGRDPAFVVTLYCRSPRTLADIFRGKQVCVID